MKIFILSIFATAIFLLPPYAHAQRSQIHEDAEAQFRKGVSLFELEQYGSAIPIFRELSRPNSECSPAVVASSKYYHATSAMFLYQEDAKPLLLKFISEHPESPQVIHAWLQLGRIHFRSQDFAEAARNFESTSWELLMKDELAEYFFKYGYSLFMMNNYPDALVKFEKTLANPSVWTSPAHYYSGQIYFESEKYQKALSHFLEVKGDKHFSRVVPFYILQIYYNQNQYQEALSYGKTVADTLKGSQRARILRLVAESAFQIKSDAEAIKYYEKYRAEFGSPDREGNYRLGMSYYRLGNLTNAAQFFRLATSEDDSISQSAYYYLSEIFIRIDSKRLALDALRLAAALSHQPDITRDALFNFAKLSFEMGLNPYNEAVEALDTYLKKYPNAHNAEEAKQLMVEIYLGAKNYKDALVSLSKMPNKSPKLKMAEQRILYFRGLELFNNLELASAKSHFQRAIEENIDPVITAESSYWLGESHFKLKEYESAIKYWETFLSIPTARNFEHYGLAWYNLGYARLKLKQYDLAIREFRSFLDRKESNAAPGKKQDATLRLADCYFMVKNFNKALQYYSDASTGNSQADYALLQKGVLEGLNGNHSAKHATLQRLTSQFPQSPYREEATFESGRALVRNNEPDRAISVFEQFIQSFPKSAFVPRTFLELGLIYYNRSEEAPALSWFKRIAAEFPQSSQKGEAIRYIQTIYTQNGQVSEWLEYAQNNQSLGYNQAELDSGAFAAVNAAIQNGDCNRIVAATQTYLTHFPKGLFQIQGKHHLAECLFTLKRDEDALPYYEQLTDGINSEFTENAALKAAFIHMMAQRIEKAIHYYSQLEKIASNTDNLMKSRENLMRGYYRTKQWNMAIQYAKALLTFEKINPSQSLEADYILVKSYLETNDLENVLATARKLTSRPGSEMQAEAMYLMGVVLYKLKDFKQAEREMRIHIPQMGAYPKWMGESFLLLSDIYIGLDDLIQAKSPLQTLINRHQDPEIKARAREKVATIEAMERDRNRRQFEDSMELNLND